MTGPSGTASGSARQIARFARQMRWRELPQTVRREGPRAFVNWLGCALGGSATQTMVVAIRGLSSGTDSGPAGVIGRSERTDATTAAMLNTISSTCYTFDDTHLQTITHPTGPVAAALLALASEKPVSGQAYLAALLIGMEIECRVSLALVGTTGNASRGWYITGVSGGIGVAVACGLIFDLSEDQLVSAIGLAAVQACGLRGAHASMAMALVPGLAARNGMTAARLAQAGFTCSEAALDGANGLLDILAPGSPTKPLVDALGTRYEVLGNAYKPYPCGIVIHPAIDACLAVAGDAGLACERIAAVHLRVHPDVLRLTARKFPADALASQVSLFHWAAISLLRGRATLAEASDAAACDPAAITLQHRMDAEPDASLAPDQAVLTVRLADGEVLCTQIDHARGSIANPMSDADLSAKFLALSRPVLGDAEANVVLARSWSIETADDVAALAGVGPR